MLDKSKMAIAAFSLSVAELLSNSPTRADTLMQGGQQNAGVSGTLLSCVKGAFQEFNERGAAFGSDALVNGAVRNIDSPKGGLGVSIAINPSAIDRLRPTINPSDSFYLGYNVIEAWSSDPKPGDLTPNAGAMTLGISPERRGVLDVAGLERSAAMFVRSAHAKCEK